MDMNQLLERSNEIIQQAITDMKPVAIVAMMSGGRDSMAAYQTAKMLGVPLTHIMHGNTRTGIAQTTEFVRTFAVGEGLAYIEADAGDIYEKRVLKKGFYGRGRDAHAMAYHELKAGPFRHAISKHIRQRQKNRPVLFLNGARASESANRAQNMPDPVRQDNKNPNYWVNICHEWSQSDRDAFLLEVKAPVNPVTRELCRSGECCCGSTQPLSLRDEIKALNDNGLNFQHASGIIWDKWLTDLENRAFAAGHSWGWGETCDAMNPTLLERNGQMSLEFQPMCVSCVARTA